MPNIAICEDETIWKDQLLQILNEIRTEDVLHIQTFHSGKELLDNFTYGAYDIIFMDIYMNGMNGVDTVASVRAIDADVFIAFTTTSKDYALEGYRLNVMKYIEKPAKKQDIIECLKLAQLTKKLHNQITLKIGGKEQSFTEEQILYLEQKNHSIMLHLSNNDTMSFTGKLDIIEDKFSKPPFYRCHKSFLVNLGQVNVIDKNLMIFVMKNGNNVYIRRGNLKEAESVLDDYLFQKLRES